MNNDIGDIVNTEVFDDTIKVLEQLEKHREEHLTRIPVLAQEYMTKGRAVLDREEWERWDTLVIKELHGIYRGENIKCFLEIAELLHNGENFERAKETMSHQNHSGCSFTILCFMLNDFCPRGREFTKFVKVSCI